MCAVNQASKPGLHVVVREHSFNLTHELTVGDCYLWWPCVTLCKCFAGKNVSIVGQVSGPGGTVSI